MHGVSKHKSRAEIHCQTQSLLKAFLAFFSFPAHKSLSAQEKLIPWRNHWLTEVPAKEFTPVFMDILLYCRHVVSSTAIPPKPAVPLYVLRLNVKQILEVDESDRKAMERCRWVHTDKPKPQFLAFDWLLSSVWTFTFHMLSLWPLVVMITVHPLSVTGKHSWRKYQIIAINILQILNASLLVKM